MMGLATVPFKEDHHQLPPVDGAALPDLPALAGMSWRTYLLPYIDTGQNSVREGVVYSKLLQGEYPPAKEAGPTERWNRPELTSLQLYPFSSSVPGKTAQPWLTFYRVFVGGGAAFDRGKPTQRTEQEFPDGLDKTILIVEAGEAVPWTKPEELDYDPGKPLPKLGGQFPDGFYALFADGKVRFIPRDTDERAIRAMITRNGGEQVELPPAVDTEALRKAKKGLSAASAGPSENAWSHSFPTTGSAVRTAPGTNPFGLPTAAFTTPPSARVFTSQRSTQEQPPATVQDNKEAQAIELVKKLGGSYQALTDRIILQGRKVTGEDLKSLQALKNVDEINLSHAQFTDADLKYLAGFPNLQRLDLTWTAVTDAGLKELGALTGLKELALPNTKVTDQGLPALAGMEHLEELDLGSTQVTGAGLKDVGKLKSLRNLALGDTKVTDDSLKDLAGLQQLKNLYLPGTKVTDAGLKYVAALPNLETLALSGTKVTDAGLKQLAPLTKLQDLSLYFTKVTDAGIADLKKALPNCHIAK